MIIYLDMDGVLCNFDDQYIKVNGIPPSLARRDSKDTDDNWDRFVKTKSFEKLDYYPGAELLLKLIKVLSSEPGVIIEILSSSGGSHYHEEVMAQKLKWLKDHDIPYKANIVSGRSKKKNYANEHSVLIDDTEDVIDAFNKAGGTGILHKRVNETVHKLVEIYFEYKKKHES